MQLVKIAILTLMSWTVIPSVAPQHGAAGPHDGVEDRRELTASEARRAMRYVYEGKSRSAVALIDSLDSICGEEPFYLLIKSRVARERLTVDDDNKDRLTAETEPIHRDLEKVIEVCTRRMDAKSDGGGETAGPDPRLRLYRGLAWMSKSHLRSFARSFWSAGRDAKKGKSDLEAYLKTDPDDPLALGTMGVFLYFADTIPKAFKYLSKLLFMPTGDRDKGLRFIAIAAATESVLQTDFQVAQHTIDLLFEGRHEDGLDGTAALLERWPAYPRLALPLALMQPFDPMRVPRTARRIDDMMERFHGEEEPGEAEQYSLALLSFLNSYADRFVAPPDVAEEGLNRAADATSAGPDWSSGYAAFELGRLLASQGRDEDARSAFDWVRRNENVAFLRGDAKRMVKALADTGRVAGDVEPHWITEIYFGEPDERAASIWELNSVTPATAPAVFYRADAQLLSGDNPGALAAFEDLLEMDVYPWDEEFQMLAASRAAEIYGSRGDYAAAVKLLDRALKHYSKEYLVDWVLEGRKRYYERLRDGDDLPAPRVLIPPQ